MTWTRPAYQESFISNYNNKRINQYKLNVHRFTLKLTWCKGGDGLLWKLSSCSQHCCIDWNSAVLCFKRLLHIGVWTFARFVRPLVLATIRGIMGILSPVYHVFPCWQKQKDGRQKGASPHRFWSRPKKCFGLIEINVCFHCLVFIHIFWLYK